MQVISGKIEIILESLFYLHATDLKFVPPRFYPKYMDKFYLRSLQCCVLILCFSMLASAASAGVATTRHNLSVSNPIPGAIKATSETEICIFCHTPHNASPSYPLWNHQMSYGVNYKTYESETLKSYSPGNAPPIDGFSKMCLGCHDGTIALGALVGFNDLVETNPTKLTEDNAGYLGTDLSGGHPISIVYDDNLVSERAQDQSLMQLNTLPLNDPYVKLYPTQNGYGVQCTSCHDPHTNRTTQVNPDGSGNPWPPLWQKETYDAVCQVCHHPADKIPGDVTHDNPNP